MPWPVIAELAGKIICLTGDETAKKKYALTDPEGASASRTRNALTTKARRVFCNPPIPTRRVTHGWWYSTRQSGKEKALSQDYELNSGENGYACLESGYNFIAIGKIENPPVGDRVAPALHEARAAGLNGLEKRRHRVMPRFR